jgi:hypothetical protein
MEKPIEIRMEKCSVDNIIQIIKRDKNGTVRGATSAHLERGR